MTRLHSLILRTTVTALAALLTASCDGGGGGSNRDSDFAWLIPADEVVAGGPRQDGIPAIDDPYFESASTIDTVRGKGLVVVVRYRGEIKAYPHDILDWHEVVNVGPREPDDVIGMRVDVAARNATATVKLKRSNGAGHILDLEGITIGVGAAVSGRDHILPR